MANMFDTKEPVQQGDSNINDDIIDVWAMDFSDPDTWLLQPSQDIADNSIRDSHTWWKKNIERDCNNYQENKRLIDTRTFTRPKKRSGRLSFESIRETNVSNVWNRQILENIGTKQGYSDDTEIAPSQREHVPCMLRISMPGASNRLVETPFASGHRSLETVRRVSRSNEIDTFVDLAETESNEDIMEISQPSVFYSSIMSVTTDDLSEGIDEISELSRQPEIEDSQILTESMMAMSMFGDVYDVNFNDTFAKNSTDATVEENITYCSPIDTTFLAGSVIKSKKTLDNTFNTMTFNRKTISHDATWVNVPNTKPQNAMFDVHKLDATFEKTPVSSPKKLSNYLVLKEPVPLDDAPMIMNERVINETFVAPCEKIDLVNQHKIRIDATFDKTPTKVLSPTKSLNDYVSKKKSPSLKVSTKVAENIDPDLDDRLSVRSDGSSTSYSMGTMNIDEFQKIIRIREECMMKQESTPKTCRGVLENNWVTSTNDLLSPILKNGPEMYESGGSSPGSIDSAVKTSSPLLSTTQSLQNLTQVYSKSDKDHRIEGTNISQRKIVAPRTISQAAVNQTRNPREYKMGIRPSSSWTSTDRPVSGIPRPRSRIPAPKFIRLSPKINEGDKKK